MILRHFFCKKVLPKVRCDEESISMLINQFQRHVNRRNLFSLLFFSIAIIVIIAISLLN